MNLVKIVDTSKTEPSAKFATIITTQILPFLTPTLQSIISTIPIGTLEELEEIRLRQGKPLIIRTSGREYFVGKKGASSSPHDSISVLEEDINRVVQLLTNSSLYAVSDKLRQGYLTIQGGHRIGFAGDVVVEGGRVKTIRNIVSVNVRVAREILGSADQVMPYLINQTNGGLWHTLVISPPRAGKTTLLRDIVRQASNGIPSLNFPGLNVGLVDERSEIAGSFNGVPQNDVGIRTDVMDGCPKNEGIMMLLRSMAPDLIATDEIGKKEDVEILEDAANAGISILATVHATDWPEVSRRPGLHPLLAKKIFQRVIVLGRTLGPGTLEQIMNPQTGQILMSRPMRRG
ncbi:MAG: stage III sporulation protein AA [Bacillota bacterium]